MNVNSISGKGKGRTPTSKLVADCPRRHEEIADEPKEDDPSAGTEAKPVVELLQGATHLADRRDSMEKPSRCDEDTSVRNTTRKMPASYFWIIDSCEAEAFIHNAIRRKKRRGEEAGQPSSWGK